MQPSPWQIHHWAHKRVAGQKPVHSGTTVTAQEEKVEAGMEEKGERRSGGKGDGKEEAPFEIAQPPGPLPFLLCRPLGFV